MIPIDKAIASYYNRYGVEGLIFQSFYAKIKQMPKESINPLLHDRPLIREDAAKEYAREKAADHDGTLTPEQQANREKNMLLASKVALDDYMKPAKENNYMPHVDLDSDTTKWITQTAEMNLADTLYMSGSVRDPLQFAKSMHKDVAHKIERDKLTGLLNSEELESILESEPYNAKAAIFVDCFEFGKLNKKYSQKCGDEVLKIIAEAMNRQARGNDLVARRGKAADEFIAVIRESRNSEPSQQLSEESIEGLIQRMHQSLDDILETARLNDESGASDKPDFKGLSLKVTDVGEDGVKRQFTIDPADIKISVGGVPWDPEHSLEDNMDRAEKRMKKQKNEQREALDIHR